MKKVHFQDINSPTPTCVCTSCGYRRITGKNVRGLYTCYVLKSYV